MRRIVRKLRHDISGQTIGMLTVVKATKNKYGRDAYLCKCECGNEVTILITDLERGFAKSCGCLKESSLNTRFNKWLKGCCERQLTKPFYSLHLEQNIEKQI